MSEPIGGGTFDTRRYWEERLRTHPGLAGVGHLGRSSRFLAMQYAQRARQADFLLRQAGVLGANGLADLDILDVGSGTGYWIEFWHRREARSVAGLDFADASVEGLRRRFPGDVIVQADVSAISWPLLEEQRFGLVSAFDVLLHVVDDIAFSRALGNLAARCVPGGWILVGDAIRDGRGFVPRASYRAHSRPHPRTAYREILEGAGCRIMAVAPATMLMAAPFEAISFPRYAAYAALWKVSRIWQAHEGLSTLIGPIAVRADRVLCNLCRDGRSPTSKLLLARKLA